MILQIRAFQSEALIRIDPYIQVSVSFSQPMTTFGLEGLRTQFAAERRVFGASNVGLERSLLATHQLILGEP